MLECQLVNTVWDFYSEMVTVTKKIVLKVSKSRDLLTMLPRHDAMEGPYIFYFNKSITQTI